MIPKLLLIYSSVLVCLISSFLTKYHDGFILLSMISMGFVWGFMANQQFFRE